uniref:Uncharacterized protein n=1 Tax=Romanomermis culicivorax TaxID=13658 RepID=A0A915JIT4_ROMCU
MTRELDEPSRTTVIFNDPQAFFQFFWEKLSHQFQHLSQSRNVEGMDKIWQTKQKLTFIVML